MPREVLTHETGWPLGPRVGRFSRKLSNPWRVKVAAVPFPVQGEETEPLSGGFEASIKKISGAGKNVLKYFSE